MERELQVALGKILGETYKIQKEQGICNVTDGLIFGLLNGFQDALDSQFANADYFSVDEVEKVADVLSPYWSQEKDIEDMPSFLAFRMSLEREGISHGRLLTILKYLRANDRFSTEIDKLTGAKAK